MENYEAVRKALLANRANTLALLGCLRETLEERPFREAEEALAGSRAMALTTQTPHALYAMLLKCGAVEAIEVPEESDVDANGSLSDGAKLPRWWTLQTGARISVLAILLTTPAPIFPTSPWTTCCAPPRSVARYWMSSSPRSVSASFWPPSPTATAMPTTACWLSARRELPKPT